VIPILNFLERDIDACMELNYAYSRARMAAFRQTTEHMYGDSVVIDSIDNC
jgi:hypothetical protein